MSKLVVLNATSFACPAYNNNAEPWLISSINLILFGFPCSSYSFLLLLIVLVSSMWPEFPTDWYNSLKYDLNSELLYFSNSCLINTLSDKPSTPWPFPSLLATPIIFLGQSLSKLPKLPFCIESIIVSYLIILSTWFCMFCCLSEVVNDRIDLILLSYMLSPGLNLPTFTLKLSLVNCCPCV